MNYAKINKTDIANGSGVRVSVFFSGCRHRCKGCFNPETWSFKYGKRFTTHTIDEILEAMDHDYIAGLSVLGGEPFEPENIIGLSELCYWVKTIFPRKTIWVYTGFDYEELKDLPVLSMIDVLVDGEFIEAEKDITLKFRGSRNQRIIDVQASIKAGEIKLWEG